MAVIDPQINRVGPRGFEFHLVDVDDEIHRRRLLFPCEFHFHGAIDRWQDGAPVSVRDTDTHFVFAFFEPAESQPERQRALGVYHGELRAVNGVKSAEHIEFAPGDGCGVT